MGGFHNTRSTQNRETQATDKSRQSKVWHHRYHNAPGSASRRSLQSSFRNKNIIIDSDSSSLFYSSLSERRNFFFVFVVRLLNEAFTISSIRFVPLLHNHVLFCFLLFFEGEKVVNMVSPSFLNYVFARGDVWNDG